MTPFVTPSFTGLVQSGVKNVFKNVAKTAVMIQFSHVWFMPCKHNNNNESIEANGLNVHTNDITRNRLASWTHDNACTNITASVVACRFEAP